MTEAERKRIVEEAFAHEDCDLLDDIPLILDEFFRYMDGIIRKAAEGDDE